MITVKLSSPIEKDYVDNGFRKGDRRLTVTFIHENKEIKCIILPSTDTDGESLESYYDGINTTELWLSGEGIFQQITNHLSEKVLEGYFDMKEIGFEYKFSISEYGGEDSLTFKVL